MAQTFFVTGTDTDVGKTLVTAAFLALCREKGFTVSAMKPVAAGAESRDGELKNTDALVLQEGSTVRQPYSIVNPVCLAQPIAPHIAAAQVGRLLDARQVVLQCRKFMAVPADYCFIEGAGGWRVPLNFEETYADVVTQLDIPVILVIGLKLGCLNHALLTAEAIQNAGGRLAGWVGNQCQRQPMAGQQANVDTLRHMLKVPCLGVVPYIEGGAPYQAASGYLSLPPVTESPMASD